MWDGAIQSSTQRITDALLHRAVLPRDALAFEKVSGAIAVRAALRLQIGEQSLLFAVPEAEAATARHIVAALLVGDHAHGNAYGAVPPEEARSLLKGDVVLVTQAIAMSKARLDELPIGKGQRLSDIWEVATLSRYTAAKSSKPRVFLTNPGWLAKSTGGRRFGAIVIDASHPSTLAKLPELMRLAGGLTSLRIAVAPPPSESTLAACGYPSKLKVWMWDPQAKRDAETAVEAPDAKPHTCPDRLLWVCDSDDETASALAAAYKSLAAAAKASEGRHYPGLRQCWSIYNRLRQVAVPLAQLEQTSAATWAGNIRRQLDDLTATNGYGIVAWDTTWPQLLSALRSAYETLLRREETAKFWAVASSLEAFLQSDEAYSRVVVGSEAEVTLLVPALESIVEGLKEAVASGRVEFTTGSKEARLVAEGATCPTVLLAPRTNGYRYLDVFTSSRTEELLYPHEVDAERNAQTRLHAPWISRVSDEARVQFLEPYGFKPLKSAVPRNAARPPTVVVRRSDGHAVSLVAVASVSAELDIDELASSKGVDVFDGQAPIVYSSTGAGGASTEVRFTNGETRQYYSSEKVDVYLSETSSIQRHSPANVRRGWQIITFVDTRYDDLFHRLGEAVSSRLAPSERAALELWRKAKERLLEQHENKRQLHEKLVSRGLKSSYGTFISWFGQEATDVIAPQQFEDFKVLATEISAYKESTILLESTFRAVQHERGRSRSLGRALSKFLRAVVSGDGYEEALSGARSLDAAIADVFAAVEVLEVDSVHEVQRSQDG